MHNFFSSHYYFFSASLPHLVLGQKPEISFNDLMASLNLNLNQRDLKKIYSLRRIFDIYNIRSCLLEKEFDLKGNLSEKELNQALLLQEEFPLYIFDFLDQFKKFSEKMIFFSGLINLYFREEALIQTGFLKQYFQFERTWRIVLMAIRAKQSKKKVLHGLKFEDPKDPLILHLLAQESRPSYDPPIGYEELKAKYLSCGPDPWQQNKIVAEWRLHQIEELVQEPFFSIDWILSYVAQLFIIEQWNEMNTLQGQTIVEAFLS